MSPLGLFGIKRCGVHVNGYVKNDDGSMCLWVQKRAYTKPTWPGKLDNVVIKHVVYVLCQLHPSCVCRSSLLSICDDS